MTDLIVSPAYGRDYQTIEAAKADWNANKDFRIHYPWGIGSYLNKSAWEQYGTGEQIWVRFNALTEKELLA